MAPQIRRGVVRTDICTLRPVERRADGTIRVDAHLTRCGVFQYMQPDGTIRRELRLPEDVFEPASLESFHGVPVTNDHPPGMITARNARQYAVGSQLGAIVRDEDHVRSRLSVFDGDTIDSMGAGKTQVSCGYTCDTVEQPGVHPLYGPYDAIQKNIRGNHIAIVDRGRAGITAAVRMDGMMVVDGDWDESAHPRAENGKFGESSGGSAGAASKSAHSASETARALGLKSSHEAASSAHVKAAQEHEAHAASIESGLRYYGREQSPSETGEDKMHEHRAAAEQHMKAAAAHAEQAKTAPTNFPPVAPKPAPTRAGKGAKPLKNDPKAAPKQGAAIIDEHAAKALVTSGAGEHPDIGPEKLTASNKIKQGAVDHYTSPNGDHRYVLKVKGEPVAALHVKSGDGKIAQISTIYTNPDHRRQGLANALQKHASKDFEKIKHAPAEELTAEGRAWKSQRKGPKRDSAHATGMGVASRIDLCKSRSMSLATPTARIEVVVRTDGNPDPDDEASRNASGANNAPAAPKRQPGMFADKGGDQVETFQDPDDEDEDMDLETDGDQPLPPPAKKGPPQAEGDEPAPPADDEDPDADPDVDPDADPEAGDDVHPFRPGDGSMYDEDGNLTEEATRKIAASSFAVPGKMHLPIHDPRALKHTMKDFGNYPFQASDEKHAAYNRISGKAKQFGINTAGFEKAHAGKLDRIDRKDTMTEDMKALQAKAEKRKEKLVAAKARIDSLEQEVSKKDGEIASLKKDLETAKAARSDNADENKTQARIDAKIELLDKARATGAKVESKMSDVEIMRATVKHVDGDDVPADKPEPYVLAMFEGALKRAKKDANDTAKGAAALAATRTAIANPADARSDAADDTDEEAAKSRLKAASYTMWNARQENK